MCAHSLGVVPGPCVRVCGVVEGSAPTCPEVHSHVSPRTALRLKYRHYAAVLNSGHGSPH
eukprot:scaffold73619_cov75-Phaeocystis_antarctica.AAC.3